MPWAIKVNNKKHQTDKYIHLNWVQVLYATAGHILIGKFAGLKKKRLEGMKKLVVEMEIITYCMIKHMPKAFFYLQIFLPAVVAKFPL